MHLAWVWAANQTKVNKPGLAVAAAFVVVMLIVVLRASQLNHRRTKRGVEYAREEHVAGASAAPLPAHTWQAIAKPDLSLLLGFPNADATAQMPALARFVIHQAERGETVKHARSTALTNTTLVVFDQLQDLGNSKSAWRVCGHFGLDLNSPSLDISANEGFGTFVVGGSRMQSFKFEYEDFNQAFCVAGADQKFAFSLLDGEMMRWLLAHPRLRSLHLGGTSALTAFTPEDPATDSDAVLAFVSGFLSRIAPLVRHEWNGS